MSPHFRFAQVSSDFAAIPLLAFGGGEGAGPKRAALTLLTLLTCSVVASPGDQVDAALRLLPKPPEVVVVDSLDPRSVAAAAVWGVRPEQVRAFSLTGQSRVYVNRSVDPYKCAGQKNQTCVLLLAALIWHEAAYVDGAGEEQAQLLEEELFGQFVTERRVEFAAGQAVLRAMAARRASAGPKRPTLIRPLTSFDAAAVKRAKNGAARRLRDPECLKLLTDFRDSDGRTLDRRLETWGMSAAEYLQRLPFVDGSSRPLCQRKSVELVTTAGLALVSVCPSGAGGLNSRFAKVQLERASLSEFMIIHEMLHTLGLSENPPTSFEITEQVSRRCH